MRFAKRSSVRSITAILASACAALTLAATPALAASGYLEVGRHFELSGDRDYLRVVGKVTNPAPGGSYVVAFGLGSDIGNENLEVALIQAGSDNGSRLVKASINGSFQNVQGQNCEQTSDFDAECRRGGYNWVKDRDYRIVIDRGGVDDTGRLWTVKIVDTVTDDTQILMSIRSLQDRLAPEASMARLELTPSDCSNINTLAAVVQKPVAKDGTTVKWGAIHRGRDGDTACVNAPLTAPVADGAAKLKISN